MYTTFLSEARNILHFSQKQEIQKRCITLFPEANDAAFDSHSGQRFHSGIRMLISMIQLSYGEENGCILVQMLSETPYKGKIHRHHPEDEIVNILLLEQIVGCSNLNW